MRLAPSGLSSWEGRVGECHRPRRAVESKAREAGGQCEAHAATSWGKRRGTGQTLRLLQRIGQTKASVGCGLADGHESQGRQEEDEIDTIVAIACACTEPSARPAHTPLIHDLRSAFCSHALRTLHCTVP